MSAIEQLKSPVQLAHSVFRRALISRRPADILELGHHDDAKAGYRDLSQALRPESAVMLDAREREHVEEAFKLVQAAWDVAPENDHGLGAEALDRFMAERLPAMRTYVEQELHAELTTERPAPSRPSGLLPKPSIESLAHSRWVVAAAEHSIAEADAQEVRAEAPLKFKKLHDHLQQQLLRPELLNAIADAKSLRARLDALPVLAVPLMLWPQGLDNTPNALRALRAYVRGLERARVHYLSWLKLKDEVANAKATIREFRVSLLSLDQSMRELHETLCAYVDAKGDLSVQGRLSRAHECVEALYADTVDRLRAANAQLSTTSQESAQHALARLLSGEEGVDTLSDAKVQLQASRLMCKETVAADEWAERVQLAECGLQFDIARFREELMLLFRVRVRSAEPTTLRANLWRHTQKLLHEAFRTLKCSPDVMASLAPERKRQLDAFLYDLRLLSSAKRVREVQRREPDGSVEIERGFQAIALTGLNNARIEQAWNTLVQEGLAAENQSDESRRARLEQKHRLVH